MRKLYCIEILDGDLWKIMGNWHGMQKGYATGAFRMLVSFHKLKDNQPIRLLSYELRKESWAQKPIMFNVEVIEKKWC